MDWSMGKILTPLTVENVSDPKKSINCIAFVDTGASHLVLPNSPWQKEKFGVRRVINLFFSIENVG